MHRLQTESFLEAVGPRRLRAPEGLLGVQQLRVQDQTPRGSAVEASVVGSEARPEEVDGRARRHVPDVVVPADADEGDALVDARKWTSKEKQWTSNGLALDKQD